MAGRVSGAFLSLNRKGKRSELKAGQGGLPRLEGRSSIVGLNSALQAHGERGKSQISRVGRKPIYGWPIQPGSEKQRGE